LRIYCSNLTSKQKLLVKLAIISLVVVGVAAAIIPPVYIFFILQRNPQCK
jgi:hypothetical protein